MKQMIKHMKTSICFLLTFAMLLTLLPPQAYAASDTIDAAPMLESQKHPLTSQDSDSILSASSGGILSTGGGLSTSDTIPLEDAKIVRELTERRGEYSKEYELNNGMNLAVVYSKPVHYQENGIWKEIDNTLKAHGSGKSASYKNTAGAWQVEFPQQLEEDSAVTIHRDGCAGWHPRIRKFDGFFPVLRAK